MADVFLVNCPIANPLDLYRQGRSSPPLGLAYIGAVLIENGIDVAALDMNIPSTSLKTLKRRIEAECPAIVGISAYTETYSSALEIAGVAKSVNPDTVTIMGGPHVTFVPCDAVNTPEVDIAVRNEGEFSMLELVRYFKDGAGSLDEIKGITFMRNGRCISNAPRPFINDLDALPLPAHHLFPLSLYQYPGNILTARGCPYNCIFCAAGAMGGSRYRLRSPEGVINEVVHLVEEYGCRFFTFIDDTFTVFRDRTLRICDLIEKSGIDMQWQCSTRVNTVTRDVLERMAHVGCTTVTYGIESGSQSILDSIQKGIALKQVRDAVRWALEAGIGVFCSFMIPHPEDTRETVLQTRKLMVEMATLGAAVTLSFTAPYPGTYLYENARELGITLLSDNWDNFSTSHGPVFTTKHLTLEEIRSLYTDIVLTLEELRG